MKPIRALFLPCLVMAACASSLPMVQEPARPPEKLADCLARTGARLYGATWCEWCHKQLALFGADASKIPYIDCDQVDTLEVRPACQANGLDSTGPFPIWILGDGTRITGIRSLGYLARAASCPAPFAETVREDFRAL